jgi:type I restriction enzyme M protein
MNKLSFTDMLQAEKKAELKTTVARIDQLRTEIDAIVAEIEGEEVEA